MTTISIPDQRGVSITVVRDDMPESSAVIVWNQGWGQELHLPVEVARQVAAAILKTIPDEV